MLLIEPKDLKMVRQMLCSAQGDMTHDCWYPLTPEADAVTDSQVALIQKLIDRIDIMRPINSEGEHKWHTPHCGCDSISHIRNLRNGVMRHCTCYMRCDHWDTHG